MNRRFTVTVFGIPCSGTVREWIEDALATVLMVFTIGVIYVFMAVAVA
jgi:hypothetical protein